MSLGERWTMWVWSGQPIDPSILHLHGHDGSVRAIAREVYHRLAARLASISVYKRQWGVILVAVFIAFIGLGAPGSGMSADARFASGCGVFLLGMLGGALMLPLLMKGVCGKGGDEARQVVERIFIRRYGADAPDDLKDPWRHGWLTSDGRPVAAEISEADARSTPLQQRANWWAVSLIAFSASLASVAGWGFSGSVVAFGAVILKFMMDQNPAAMREAELRLAEAVEGSAFVAAGAKPWARRIEAAREKQIENATKDKSPLFFLGETTGVLAARGDLLAPSAGLPFALSLRDLQMHLLVFGGTGSGKTTGVLKPLIYQAAGRDKLGIVVMDGKGALPGELKRIKDNLKIITPGAVKISLVAGVEPGLVVDTLVEILGSQAKDRFWVDSAAGLMRHAAVLASAVAGGDWTLMQAVQIAMREDAAKKAVESLKSNIGDDSPELAEAIAYLTGEFPKQDEKMRSGIIAQARSWVTALTAHPDILTWANTPPSKNEVDICGALQGERIGLLVPAHRYGAAGAVVSALLKARLYAKLKDRADNSDWEQSGETPVMLIVDEAQEVATADDASMLAIGRSLGLAMVAATQTVEGVVARLGEQQAQKWLSIFGGLVVLAGRSRKTDELVSARLGSAWLLRTEQVHGTPVRDAIHANVLAGPLAASMTQPFFAAHLGTGGENLAKAAVARATQGVAIAFKKAWNGEQPQNPPDTKLGVSPLLDPGEASALLAEPDTALVVATRGRVIRRDVVVLAPAYDGAPPGSPRKASGEVLGLDPIRVDLCPS